MEIFKLFGSIFVNSDAAERSISKTGKDAEGLTSIFGKVGEVASKLGKVIVAGAAAGATAVAALATSALEGYADYEQLVGGVETLFGTGGKSLEEYAASVGKTTDEVKEEYDSMMKAQETVLENADKAYKTAGMRANEYMETVTSFSASLIQSLDGDTAAAAEKANQAIIDMSDNANKMGSDIESIQNAYQGFAKQNYTMLDNLKLGYGGTKEEMQRLLEDAQAISGIEYDISSYADVTDAIHVIQEEMGIAGTTAKEASSTISGSISSMKSAWSNLVAGLGGENANISSLMKQFVDSVITVASNVVPRMKIILVNIWNMIIHSLPTIINEIAATLKDLIPNLVDSVSASFSSAIQQSGLSDVLKNLFSDGFLESIQHATQRIGIFGQRLGETAVDTFSGKLSGLKDMFSAFGTAMQPIVENYLLYFMQMLENIILTVESVVIPIISLLIDVFVDLATSIAESIAPAVKDISDKWTEMCGLISDYYTESILPVIQGFIEILSELWAENQDKITAIGELFGAVFNAISEIFTWFCNVVIKGILIPAIEIIVTAVHNNMDNIKAVFQSAFDYIGGIVKFFTALFKGDWQGMWEAIKTILKSGYEFIQNVFNLIRSFMISILAGILSKVKEIFESIRLAIVNKINQAKDSVTTVFTKIKETISEKLEAAKKIVSDIFDSIKKAITDKIEAAKKVVTDTIDKIKEAFNFEWKLPDLKLPHIKIEGEWSFNPPKVPTFGIEWYKDGGIMTDPTVFGFNPTTGKAMVGGEAGPEAVAPITTLQKYVAEAVDNRNEALIEVLTQILKAIMGLDDSMESKLYTAMSGLRLQMNEREFARLVKGV